MPTLLSPSSLDPIAAPIRRPLPWVAFASSLWLLAASASAQPLSISFDQAATFGGAYVADEEVVRDDAGSTGLLVEDLGPLPSNVDVRAVHGDEFFAFFALDRTATLSGGLVVTPRDVVQWDGSGYAIAWDGDVEGLGRASIDAITRSAVGDLMISVDRPIYRAGVLYADEDVIDVGTTSYSMAFDGSAYGVVEGLDLDGVHYEAEADAWYATFDAPGMIAGVAFGDEDVLRFDATGVTVAYALPVAAGVDTDALHAVPEPGLIPCLTTGIAFLHASAQTRARRRRNTRSY